MGAAGERDVFTGDGVTRLASGVSVEAGVGVDAGGRGVMVETAGLGEISGSGFGGSVPPAPRRRASPKATTITATTDAIAQGAWRRGAAIPGWASVGATSRAVGISCCCRLAERASRRASTSARAVG